MSISGRNARFLFVVLIGSGLLGWWAADAYGPLQWQAERTTNLFAVVAQIAATMMGFLLAALAILASIAGTRLVRNLQRTGHYAVLLSRLFIAAALFFLLLVHSGAAMFLLDRLPLALEGLFALSFSAGASLVQAAINFARVLIALRPAATTLE